jgi:hypothetical protein
MSLSFTYRYNPEVGDLVVGRITEVGHKIQMSGRTSMQTPYYLAGTTEALESRC